MTILIATVTKEFALLSQDTVVSSMKGSQRCFGVTQDIMEAARSAYVGTGQPPEDRTVSFASKIRALPHMRMLVGGTGSYRACLAWCEMLACYGLARNVRELDSAAPAMLEKVRQWAGQDQAFMVVHVGYDPEEDTCKGFAYASADGFRSAPLGAGHTTMPPPNTSDPDYPALSGIWVGAAYGQDTADFHHLYAINVHRAYLAGMFCDGAGIGGELHTARVDRDGISIRTAHEFPRFQDQLAELRYKQQMVERLKAAFGGVTGAKGRA